MTNPLDPDKFEMSGNFADWPKNVPGKPTQVAVFGIRPRSTSGARYDITFTGKFPDLETAMYWGGKKELTTLRRKEFQMASRVLWQHELTPEEAVRIAFAQAQPQTDRALGAADLGFDPIAHLERDQRGPLRPVNYSEVKGFVVDFEPLDDGDSGPPF